MLKPDKKNFFLLLKPAYFGCFELVRWDLSRRIFQYFSYGGLSLIIKTQ